MRILLLADPYIGLYKPIEKELCLQGHCVYTVLDKQLSPFSFLESSCYRELYLKIKKPYQRYWEKQILEHKELSEPFDLLFCIQGYSFHPYLLYHLKKMNPCIQTRLYVWDSNRYYNYFRNNELFDSVFSFDWNDSKQFHVKFLPFFWTPSSQLKLSTEFTISFIGTEHSNRLAIIEQIAQQLKEQNIKFYFKVLVGKPEFGHSFLKKLLHHIFYYKKEALVKKEYERKCGSPFSMRKKMDVEEVERIISMSDCILDIDRELQSGVTPRVIWALAANKKIITTNEYMKDLPFFNEDQVLIIDRHNPIIDKDFLRRPINNNIPVYIQNLCIDKWVLQIIR